MRVNFDDCKDITFWTLCVSQVSPSRIMLQAEQCGLVLHLQKRGVKLTASVKHSETLESGCKEILFKKFLRQVIWVTNTQSWLTLPSNQSILKPLDPLQRYKEFERLALDRNPAIKSGWGIAGIEEHIKLPSFLKGFMITYHVIYPKFLYYINLKEYKITAPNLLIEL